MLSLGGTHALQQLGVAGEQHCIKIVAQRGSGPDVLLALVWIAEVFCANANAGARAGRRLGLRSDWLLLVSDGGHGSLEGKIDKERTMVSVVAGGADSDSTQSGQVGKGVVYEGAVSSVWTDKCRMRARVDAS